MCENNYRSHLKSAPTLFLSANLNLGLPYGTSSFLTKKNLSSKDAKKWPNVFLFGIMNSEHMSNHSFTKNFGKFQCKQQPADVVTFYFFGLHLFLSRKIDICEHYDLSVFFFFYLHLFLGRKMDICDSADIMTN